MLADLEYELEAFARDDLRLQLFNAVWSGVSSLTITAQIGGLTGLCSRPAVMPRSDGVSDAGSSIAEIAGHLDGGDLYAGVALSTRTALSLFDAHVEWASGINDLEDEHGLDAIIRLVGLGLVAEGLSDSDSDGAAREWLETESGRAMLLWFAVVEVSVAFGTDDEPADGDRVLALLDSFFDPAIEAWSDLASERALARARIIVNNWTDVLCPAVDQAQAVLQSIVDDLRSVLSSVPTLDAEGLSEESRRVGVYRSLVARLVGEYRHGALDGDAFATTKSVGPLDPPSECSEEAGQDVTVSPGMEESTAQTLSEQTQAHRESILSIQRQIDIHRSDLAASRQERQACGTQLDANRARVEALGDRRARIGETLEGLRVERNQTLSKSAGVQPERTSAEQALSSSSLRLESANAELTTATEQLKQAEQALRRQQEVTHSATTSVVTSLSAQTESWITVRQCAQQLLTLRTAGEHLRQLQQMDDEGDALRRRIAPLKEQLVALRKRRRSAAKTVQARTISKSASREQIQETQDEIEGLITNQEQKSAVLKNHRERLKKMEDQLRKRHHRVAELEDRQAGADAVVSGLSDAIAEIRKRLNIVIAEVDRGHEAVNQARLRRRKFIRKRLATLQESWSGLQTQMAPLAEGEKARASHLATEMDAYDALKCVVDQKRAQLKSLKTERKQAAKSRETHLKLVRAAVDMMRKNAGRLEDAHDALRTAQKHFDATEKNQNLLSGQIDRLASDIKVSQRAESEFKDQADRAAEAIEQAQSALNRHDKKMERAQMKRSAMMAERAVTVREEIQSKKRRISVLREQVADAIEDREGLAVAEVRIDASKAKAQQSRSAIVERLRRLQNEQKTAATSIEQHQKLVQQTQDDLDRVAADIDGCELTIRGLLGDQAAREKRAKGARSRMRHLDAVVVRERDFEDEAVERVADFQNWVERTQAAIAKLEQPTAPVNVPEPPKVSKVDRLLAQLHSEREVPVPDTAETFGFDGGATVMVDRTQLLSKSKSTGTTENRPVGKADDDVDGATEVFTPEDVLKRLQEESGEDGATVMMPRTKRRPPRQRDDD